MRENRTCGSEGGEGVSPSRPLSSRPYGRDRIDLQTTMPLPHSFFFNL